MPHAFPAAAVCGPRQLVPRTWAPLSDAEFAALRPWLAGADAASPGRRPSNLRRTLDAIFWVAASRGPWKDLPAELGKPDTASRALRRWARAGRLEPLLVKALHPDAEGCQALRGLGYWLARAFRRMARIVSTAALALVRDALCVVDAWPANPLRLPDRQLSETARKSIRAVGKALELNTLLFVRAGREGDAQEVEARWKTHRIIARTLRAGWRQLRLGVCGNRHQWRLR
jgi:transposase